MVNCVPSSKLELFVEGLTSVVATLSHVPLSYSIFPFYQIPMHSTGTTPLSLSALHICSLIFIVIKPYSVVHYSDFYLTHMDFHHVFSHPLYHEFSEL